MLKVYSYDIILGHNKIRSKYNESYFSENHLSQISEHFTL